MYIYRQSPPPPTMRVCCMIVVDPTCQIVSNHSKSHGELFNKMYIDHPRL